MKFFDISDNFASRFKTKLNLTFSSPPAMQHEMNIGPTEIDFPPSCRNTVR